MHQFYLLTLIEGEIQQYFQLMPDILIYQKISILQIRLINSVLEYYCQLINITMLTFEQQSKILTPILSRETNKHCADCGSTSPTWASLDFGVLLCSNCSGAHRALGPTITRVKSTKLDLWQRSWVDNMRIGNNQLNKYWQADTQAAKARKPSIGSHPDDYCRYTNEKYRRRKFTNGSTEVDPLTAYKNGTYVATSTSQIQSEPVRQIYTNKKQSSNLMTSEPNQIIRKPKSESFSLLDDLDVLQVEVTIGNRATQGQVCSNKQEPDDDQFSQFVEPQQPPKRKSQGSLSLTFEELMKTPPLQSHNSQPTLNVNQSSFHQSQGKSNNGPHYVHHNYSNHAQQNYNNYHHNPYVGYVPHYNSNNFPQNNMPSNTNGYNTHNINQNGFTNSHQSHQNGIHGHSQNQSSNPNYHGFTLN